MAVDTPEVQRDIAKWTLVATTVIGGVTYLVAAKQLTYGLVFGVLISIVNNRVVSIILDIAFKRASPNLARTLTFVGYHVRFWLIVVLLYLTIPRSSYLFGVGVFLGLLLTKIIMGIFVVIHTDDEWWNKAA